MRILFLEGDMSRRGGTERMTSVLANELCKENEVHIISLKLNNGSVFFSLDERINHLVLNSYSGKFGILKQIKDIRKFIKTEKIDWIINVDVGMGFYGILAALCTSTKVITWEHGNFYNNWGSRWFPYYRKFAAKYSDAMVVLTEKDRNNYLSNISTKKPVYVIANPVTRQNFSYNVESKIILSAGLLLPIKGFDKAIEIASKVLPKYPDWKWIICGDGPERERLKSLISKFKLEKQFILIGSVENMDEQYKNSAMFVMTSEMEGLPMVLLEAKSWGLPLISFDIMTGPSDIIRDGVNGYLVEINNSEEMKKKLDLLISNESLRKSFSEQSQTDLEKYDFEHVIKRWYEVLGNA